MERRPGDRSTGVHGGTTDEALVEAGLARVAGAPFEGDERERFAREVGDTNRRRLLVLLPLMVIAHAIHLAVFRVSASERAVLSPRIVHWRDGVAAAHGITLVVAATLAATVWRYGRTRAGRWLGPLTAATYLVHGAVVAARASSSTRCIASSGRRGPRRRSTTLPSCG